MAPKKQKTSDDHYAGLCKTSASKMTRKAFQVAQPFLEDITDCSEDNFEEFRADRVQLEVLTYLNKEVMLRVLAAANMTWVKGGELLARQVLMNIMQALRSICVTLPQSGPSRAIAADKQQSATAATDEAPAAATTQAATAAAGQQELQEEFEMSEQQKERQKVDDADTEESCGSDDSVSAAHEVEEHPLPHQTAGFVILKRLLKAVRQGDKRADADISHMVMKLIVEAKDSLFGEGETNWQTENCYQLLHYLTYAALHNASQLKYAGDVVGFCTDLQMFGVCKIFVNGIITVEEDGNCSYCSAGGTAAAPAAGAVGAVAAEAFTVAATASANQQYGNQLRDATLNKVRSVEGCELVGNVIPGKYLVGKFARSQTYKFLPLPLIKPEAIMQNVNRLTLDGYMALQGLLISCAGERVCKWSVEDLKARLAEWQRRLDEVAQTAGGIDEAVWQGTKQRLG